MEAGMTNPALSVPGLLDALQAVSKAASAAGADVAGDIPDDVFDEAARYFDEPALAALVVAIAAINTWNRLNVMSRQIAGEWTAQWASPSGNATVSEIPKP
jgi:alkylhydroperoxidase family enzyme